MRDCRSGWVDRTTTAVSKAAFGAIGRVASPRLTILIFHRVSAAPDPLFPDQVDAARFDRLVALVARTFRVMTFGEALTHLETASLPARSLVLTFDDGYADNAEVALPILRRHGIAASFFIATGYLDGGRMWNDTVIEAVRATPLEQLELEEFGLGRLSVRTAGERRAAIDALLPLMKYGDLGARERVAESLARRLQCAKLPAYLMMGREQVRELHGAGMELGAHTSRHPILASLSLEVAKEEITSGRDELAGIIQAPVEVMAYPNGRPTRDYRREHVEIVREAGFRGAVTTAPGVACVGDDPFQLPRVNPWDRALPAWAARLFLDQWKTDFAVV